MFSNKQSYLAQGWGCYRSCHACVTIRLVTPFTIKLFPNLLQGFINPKMPSRRRMHLLQNLFDTFSWNHKLDDTSLQVRRFPSSVKDSILQSQCVLIGPINPSRNITGSYLRTRRAYPRAHQPLTTVNRRNGQSSF